MKNPYIPIACSFHDEYEIAIMHNKNLNIEWIDDGGKAHKGNILPTDILVKGGEEFLVAQDKEGGQLCIRLDKITLLQA